MPVNMMRGAGGLRRWMLGRPADRWLSIAAGTLMALMVAAGGTALAGTPDAGVQVGTAPVPDSQHPLVICRDDRFGHRCIPEES
jgi:hypothetical protein